MNALPVDAPSPAARRVEYACALQVHRRIRRARRGSVDRPVLWACAAVAVVFAVLAMKGMLP